jgi:hypothetical protein
MSALIALVDMAALRGCSTSGNILEGLSLLAGKRVSPPDQKVVPVPAEDIGHFQPMFPHHSDGNALAAWIMLSGSSNSRGLTVARTAVLATWR